MGRVDESPACEEGRGRPKLTIKLDAPAGCPALNDSPEPVKSW